MTHLTPEELIDAVDAALSPERRAHLDACDQCCREAQQLHALLGEVRTSTVPEPSPLFWDHFSARVRSAVQNEPPPAPVRRWFEWPVVAPLAALALLVLALVSALSTPGKPTPEADVAMSRPADAAMDAELEWALLTDLVGDVDADAMYEAGVRIGPGVADVAILQLSFGEREELMRLLREELRAGG
jgi:anti-sigma factor RsiW